MDTVDSSVLVPIENIREEARRAVGRYSIRKLAEQIGCKRGALHRFVKDETNPGSHFRALLTTWYEQRSRVARERGADTTPPGDPSAAELTVDDALNVLTVHLTPGVERVVKDTVISTLRRMHLAISFPQPDWLLSYRQPDS